MDELNDGEGYRCAIRAVRQTRRFVALGMAAQGVGGLAKRVGRERSVGGRRGKGRRNASCHQLMPTRKLGTSVVWTNSPP